MKIALLFDGVSALGATRDVLILETIEAIEIILTADGHQVVRVPATLDARWVERLRRGKIDLVFNLCEGIDGIAVYESAVLAAIELLGMPYTGSSSWTTALCLRKHIVNGLLEDAGLPVPPWGVARRGEPLPSVGFPAICKPAAEDASIGVEQRSVVRTRRALAERVGRMLERWEEVLVQRFVDGREINVGIVGDEVLPISEIDFGALPRGMWPIVTYRSKWDTGSVEDLGTSPRCPADLAASLAAEVEAIARRAWRLVGGEGYGRIDMRIDRDGQPWILELNANPDLAPDAGLARMVRTAGNDYPWLVRELCALATTANPARAAERWALAERLSGVERADEAGAAAG